MNKQMKGVFKNGVVELSEKVEVADGTPVVVTFTPTEVTPLPKKGQHMWFGMFAKPGARMSTWEDFEEAKKIWEPRDPK